MATRHQVRQSVVSLLYANEMGSEMDEFAEEFLEEKKIRNDQKKFTLELYNGVLQNLDLIDEALNIHLGKWKLGEIGSVERAILRLGAYEIKFTNTDDAIIINEAVMLANELGSDSSTRFINGVLDAISKVK
ncbi:transcription antitermination protein NusB [Campylobacter hyointestinalis subsp. hyointestinalis]|uniref:Transcription antitermination protein NusB n=1 Tax=Campylobacter hyointestinalis subsp. hyointestinalis TaxID=91352 RepID=A0A0S4SU57_CAMHY|nr:transcription antitermination factor NusB [Campylobacter hyointestinalis]RAZ45866.1 transcription antitermination factor NusB [Campylobacter hyointestinalis subsp. lawsonii]CUU89109.1 transcription antitermination protein NusB [Campylobacter hyointestinalis subsp. hyointestinalis]